MTTLIAATAARSRAAAERISQYIVRTPLLRSAAMSDALRANVWLKLENRQTTGSFKLRGATNRLLTLSDAERARGCIAASSGNHGAAVACAMQRLGVPGRIYVPEQTSVAKVQKIESYGGQVEFFGHDGLDTEQHARAVAERDGLYYLSPYNDDEVIAGQGSCGVELLEQLPQIDALFVAVGGGGLVGGIGSVLKSHRSDTEVFGAQPTASAVMAKSVEAGRILDLPSEPTLSDGTAGGIEAGSVTFALNAAVVDRFVLCDEASIAGAMRQFMLQHDERIEGAAGVALTAAEQCKAALRDKNVVIVICGGNVSDDVLAKVGELPQ